MENTYWFRFYLICSEISNNILGLKYQNFANLYREIESAYANKRMTRIFDNVNVTLCNLTANESDMIFEENDFDLIAELTESELKSYYQEFCAGCIRFIFESE
jgi:hypothetical protein